MTCACDYNINYWDTRSQTKSSTILSTRGLPIYSLGLQRDGFLFASGHDDVIFVWDIRYTKKSLFNIRDNKANKIFQLQWTAPNRLMSCGKSRNVKIWDMDNPGQVADYYNLQGKVLHAYPLPDLNLLLAIQQYNKGEIYLLSRNSNLGGYNINKKQTPLVTFDVSIGDRGLFALTENMMLQQITSEQLLDELNNNFLTIISEDDVKKTRSPQVKPKHTFEQELDIIQAKLSNQSVHIEEIARRSRKVNIKIGDNLCFIRYKVAFPEDYPASPPKFFLTEYSFSQPQIIQKIESRVRQLTADISADNHTLLQICHHLANEYTDITLSNEYFVNDIDIDKNSFMYYEESQDQLLSSTYLNSMNGHCWHPSGVLVAFSSTSKGGKQQEPQLETIYDEFNRSIWSGKYNYLQQNLEDISEIVPSLQSESNPSVIHWRDLSSYLPFNTTFLQHFNINTEMSIERLCQTNKEISLLFKRQDLADIWDAFILTLPFFADENIETWLRHPYGFPLAKRLIEEYGNRNDIFGMLLIAFHAVAYIGDNIQSEDDYLVSHCSDFQLKEIEMIPRKLSNHNISMKVHNELSIINISSRNLLFFALNHLETLLARNCLIHKSLKIRKYLLRLVGAKFVNTVEFLSPGSKIFARKQEIACKNCNQYSFVCTICEQRVRGLSLICQDCGHGGHPVHMRLWFEIETECPTGCGCFCQSRNTLQ